MIEHPADAGPVLQRELVDELFDLFGPDVLTAIAAWEQETDAAFTRLVAATSADDARAAAHSVKGGALSVGAAQVAARAGELEARAKAGVVPAPAAVEALGHTVARARAALHARAAGPTPA